MVWSSGTSGLSFYLAYCNQSQDSKSQIKLNHLPEPTGAITVDRTLTLDSDLSYNIGHNCFSEHSECGSGSDGGDNIDGDCVDSGNTDDGGGGGGKNHGIDSGGGTGGGGGDVNSCNDCRNGNGNNGYDGVHGQVVVVLKMVLMIVVMMVVMIVVMLLMEIVVMIVTMVEI